MNKEYTPYLKQLVINKQSYDYYSFSPLAEKYDLTRLPFSAKILLENLVRHHQQTFVETSHINAVAAWDTSNIDGIEIPFVPARVLLQDFTGVPSIVDLAAMRDAMSELGGDPQKINPLKPVELVIDHSVMVDFFAQKDAKTKNTQLEIERNLERYQFLKWGQQAFNNFKVVPPGTGIVHQVNLEYLARVVFAEKTDKNTLLFPDTLVGTDSHSTMINGLGVLGWGVGGIEAEAAMLGQPVSMLIPEIIGVELSGKLGSGITATDLVLTITEMLRNHGVVGKFVEFFGDGLSQLTVSDRATIANMSPEYGATCGIFPIDQQTLDYLELSGREAEQIAQIKAYCQAMDMWGTESQKNAIYHHRLKLDLNQVEACISGPKRPQDRIPLSDAANAYKNWLALQISTVQADNTDAVNTTLNKNKHNADKLSDGSVVIAAITSCTNTSNPSVMIAAGLMAKKAVALGLTVKPWVKTSFAPGSQVVTEYLKDAKLEKPLEQLGFHLVGYGCTTCIGNSGPLPLEVSETIRNEKLTVTSVLSGNRNFEGRIHSEVKANYLASPPLVVAYALAGNMQHDLVKEPLGTDSNGKPVYLKDIWPSAAEIQQLVLSTINRKMFQQKYAEVYQGDEAWQKISVAKNNRYDWPKSSYIKKPTFFAGMNVTTDVVQPIVNARCLLKLGDSVTTDHISPAGAIAKDSPAADYLRSQDVTEKDFNSYGSRRGNHEVMIRGTFANVRLRNQLAPDTEGGWTQIQPIGKQTSIFAASQYYKSNNIPTIILAGKEYGSGSSRDWAAKGPMLLGVKAVIAESYERIHRSNLIGMGLLPLQFIAGENATSLGLIGDEQFSIQAMETLTEQLQVSVTTAKGEIFEFNTKVRIDTQNEFNYFSNGGILQYVLRSLASD